MIITIRLINTFIPQVVTLCVCVCVCVVRKFKIYPLRKFLVYTTVLCCTLDLQNLPFNQHVSKVAAIKLRERFDQESRELRQLLERCLQREYFGTSTMILGCLSIFLGTPFAPSFKILLRPAAKTCSSFSENCA